MRLTRRNRTLTALLALISLLFMQLAVAAHACQVAQPVVTYVSTQVAAADMPGCAMMDSGKAGGQAASVCHEHCAPAGQSLDRTPAPDVTPFFPLLLPQSVARMVDGALPSLPDHPDASPAERGSPSLAVRHCCFRI